MQRTDNDILCDALTIDNSYSAALLSTKLNDIEKSSIDVNEKVLNLFLTEIHARIITIQHDLELRSSRITIVIMRQEIEDLKAFEKDVYDSYPEYYL